MFWNVPDDDAHQLHLPDGDINGINNMTDIMNGVHLTWEMEQLPATNDHDDDHSESTALSFHNINFDNNNESDDDDGSASEGDTNIATKKMSPLVPRTYPGISDSKNKLDEDSNDYTLDDDDHSYYGSITDPANIIAVPDNIDEILAPLLHENLTLTLVPQISSLTDVIQNLLNNNSALTTPGPSTPYPNSMEFRFIMFRTSSTLHPLSISS